jgi:hypothetical protein
VAQCLPSLKLPSHHNNHQLFAVRHAQTPFDSKKIMYQGGPSCHSDILRLAPAVPLIFSRCNTENPPLQAVRLGSPTPVPPSPCLCHKHCFKLQPLASWWATKNILDTVGCYATSRRSECFRCIPMLPMVC